MKLTIAAALVTVACMVGPAFAAGRLHVIERAINDIPVDLGAKGDSVGDQLVFSNPVYDGDDKVQLGMVQGVCVRIEVGKFWECRSTFLLQKGMITVQGRFADRDQKLSSLVITGGTGEYLGAKGLMTTADHGKKGPDGFAAAYDIFLDMK